MNRRAFIAVLAGAAASWSQRDGFAQQSTHIRRVDVLMTSAQDADGTARLSAFRQGLERLGWHEGTNVLIGVHWGAADLDRMRAMARAIVNTRPDVILATSGRSLRLLQVETRDLPIVLVGSVDPVQSGLVASIARPGGNVTGFTSLEASFAGKWLEMLKEVAPSVENVGFVFSPDNPAAPGYQAPLQSAAANLGVQLKSKPVRNANDIERALETLAREPTPGLILPLDPTVSVHQELLTKLTLQFRLPTLSGYPSFVAGGGLISYGVDLLDLYQRAATYVHRVLNGEKPADLPAQGPTKYTLAVNLKTARALGLTVPPMLLARADEVIE